MEKVFNSIKLRYKKVALIDVQISQIINSANKSNVKNLFVPPLIPAADTRFWSKYIEYYNFYHNEAAICSWYKNQTNGTQLWRTAPNNWYLILGITAFFGQGKEMIKYLEGCTYSTNDKIIWMALKMIIFNIGPLKTPAEIPLAKNNLRTIRSSRGKKKCVYTKKYIAEIKSYRAARLIEKKKYGTRNKVKQ